MSTEPTPAEMLAQGARLTDAATAQHDRIDAALDRISPSSEIDSQERLENAQYDLALAKRAWSGRSVEEIEKDLEAARAKEHDAIVRGRYPDQVKATLARFDIQKERTRALAIRACEAEVEEASRAEGVGS